MGRKLKDFKGQICGCWKVIERDLNPRSKSHETFWICECQNCKSISSVRRTDLEKNPRSCNNCKGELIEGKWKIGDQYGLLTIIDRAPSIGHNTYVKVQCACGSPSFNVRLSHLKERQMASCGCLKESNGEFKVRQVLELLNINFQTQYRIRDNYVMIFDFVLFDENNQIKYCIEYDGEQHFKPVEIFGGKEAFLIQQERDLRKQEWCEKKQIPLLRIPYTDLQKINEEYLFSKIPNLKNFSCPSCPAQNIFQK